VIESGLAAVRLLPNSCIGGGEVEKLLGSRSDSSNGGLRRRRQNNTANDMATTPIKPPTTPPAMAPAFDFLPGAVVGDTEEGRETGVVDESVVAMEEVDVDEAAIDVGEAEVERD